MPLPSKKIFHRYVIVLRYQIVEVYVQVNSHIIELWHMFSCYEFLALSAYLKTLFWRFAIFKLLGMCKFQYSSYYCYLIIRQLVQQPYLSYPHTNKMLSSDINRQHFTVVISVQYDIWGMGGHDDRLQLLSKLFLY